MGLVLARGEFRFVVTGIFAMLIAIFAQQIVDAEIGIAPGFGMEQRTLLAELMRLNLIGTMIFSISGLVMASLQANQHFVMPCDCAQHVQHRADLRRDLPRADLWDLRFGVWRHHRRGNAPAGASPHAFQIRLPLDALLGHPSHGFDRSGQVDGAASVHDGGHSTHLHRARQPRFTAGSSRRGHIADLRLDDHASPRNHP
jgi:hypothetical protein